MSETNKTTGSFFYNRITPRSVSESTYRLYGSAAIKKLTCVFDLDSNERIALAGQVPDVVHLADGYAASWSSELDHITNVQVA